MHDDRSEELLSSRLLVGWAWLVEILIQGAIDPDPVAGYVALGGLLFVATRWSLRIARESAIALVLLDAPSIFMLGGQLSYVLFALVLVAGALTLPSGLAIVLVLEVTAMQAWLLANSGVGPVETSAAMALLSALAGWALLRRARAQVS